MYSNKMIQANKNLQNLPPYIFGRIKKLKDEMRKKRTDGSFFIRDSHPIF